MAVARPLALALALLAAAGSAASSVPAILAAADTFDADTLALGVWDVHRPPPNYGTVSVEGGALRINTFASSAVSRDATLAPTGATFATVQRVYWRSGIFFAMHQGFEAPDGRFLNVAIGPAFSLLYSTPTGTASVSVAPRPVSGEDYAVALTLRDGGVAELTVTRIGSGATWGPVTVADATLAPQDVATVNFHTHPSWFEYYGDHRVGSWALAPAP